MKVAKPDQIPAKLQPNANDNQISGRKPTSALITVALRMNFASPAPRRTPSSPNTTPAIGNMATKNHHGTPTSSSTVRSFVNSSGRTDAPSPNTSASTVAATVEKAVTRAATDFACVAKPAPNAAPT